MPGPWLQCSHHAFSGCIQFDFQKVLPDSEAICTATFVDKCAFLCSLPLEFCLSLGRINQTDFDEQDGTVERIESVKADPDPMSRRHQIRLTLQAL